MAGTEYMLVLMISAATVGKLEAFGKTAISYVGYFASTAILRGPKHYL